jgi:hypothetical protein
LESSHLPTRQCFPINHEKSGAKIMERTFIILKPDAVQRGLVGEIIGRFERRGLKIVGLKFMQVSEELARKHYAVHEQRPFFAWRWWSKAPTPLPPSATL